MHAADQKSEALLLPRLGGAKRSPKPIYFQPATLPEVLKPRRIGYPLSDAQILQLLDNLPEGEAHDRWWFAIQLCAVCSLGPEELRHLRIKDGASGAELWTIYEKSMGGTKGLKTEPRMLHRCCCVIQAVQ